MVKRIQYFITFVFVAGNFLGASDSLRIKIQRAESDSARIEILYKALNRKKNSARLSDSLMNEMLLYRRSNDCFARAFCYFKAGTYYANFESPQKALAHLLNGLRHADSCGNKKAVMLIRNRIAFVNKVNDNFKVAILNAHLSLAYARELKDSFVLAENYTLLGNMYKTEYQLDSALLYHNEALNIREKTNASPQLMALTYNNLGLVYKNKKEYDKALVFLRKSLSIKKEIKDKSIYSAYNNLSIVFKRMKVYDSAIAYANKVVDEALLLKSSRAMQEGLAGLAEAYDEGKNPEKAVHYYRRLRIAEDSMNREKLTAQFHELQSRYESDKKDSDLKLKEESLKTAEALNSRKNILIVLSSIALLVTVIAIFFVYRSYRQSKESALQLSRKNVLIEAKNKEITDSITYARNIQQSLLTSKTVFKENLKDHFVLFLPKDIVSGDFYWARKTGDDFMLMCADCTGHGVPGAFMSLLGMSYLSEIIGNNQLTAPHLVLERLRARLIENFSLNNNKDGMDAALIKIKGYRLEMAAANNPVWVIRENQNMVIVPDKFPIGKHYGELRPFSLNTFELKENDLVVLFTDGYADQFGGPKNKKYKYKRLEQLLLANSNLLPEEIGNILKKEFIGWKGKNEQLDDILVIGIRI